MYFAYIRPIFEYANVVWDSAPRHDYYFTTIEKLQIAAARIVTGTNIYASKQLLYRDGTTVHSPGKSAFMLIF